MKVIFLITIMLAPSLLYSQNKKPTISIAINRFNVINCEDSLATACEEFFSGNIYKSKNFVLLERSQIDIILKRKKFNENKTFDINYATRLGKLLLVDKIIIGSLSKINTYKLDIKVINVKDSKVDVYMSMEIKNINNLESDIKVVWDNLEDFYLGKYNYPYDYSIGVHSSLVYPAGKFSGNVKYGYGVLSEFAVNEISDTMVSTSVLAGVYRFIPSYDSVDSFYMFPFVLNFKYSIVREETLNLQPGFGIGYLFTQMIYDKIRNREDENYQYKTEYFYNPLINFKIGLNYRFYKYSNLNVNLSQVFFFERDDYGSLSSIELGINFLF